MDVAMAFPSVARGCLLRKVRNMDLDINLVDWADILMRERKGVNGQDGEEMGVATGLVSPALFAIFAREASDGWKCGWTRLSPSSSAGDSDADDYAKKRKELVGRAETATGRWRGALR